MSHRTRERITCRSGRTLIPERTSLGKWSRQQRGGHRSSILLRRSSTSCRACLLRPCHPGTCEWGRRRQRETRYRQSDWHQERDALAEIAAATQCPARSHNIGGRASVGSRVFDLAGDKGDRSEEHTSELQSHSDLVCRLLLEKKKKKQKITTTTTTSY